MGYITGERAEIIKKSVGMECDRCGNKTEIVDNPAWHGYYARTYHYGGDATDNKWYIVCSPRCYFDHMRKFFKGSKNNGDFEFDDMQYEFVNKMVKND